MAAYSRILISVILVLSIGGVQSTSNYSTEHIEVRTRLYRKLLRDYEEDVRPAVNQSQPVIVGFGLSLQQLVKLDEHLQELVLDVMLRKIWADPRLTWEPEDYDGIEHLRIPVVKLWRPDIVLYNNVGDDYALLYDPYATVYHTGAINWTPKAFLRSHCLIDMTNFPFDTQRCTLMFGSWAFTNKEINLTFNPTREESVDVLDYRYSREWDLIDHSYDINHRMFSDFQVVLDFKRNPTFYTHMYLLPALLVAFIAPCVFILPPDSNEKVTLGGILLLTLTLSMSTLQGILPREQFDLPILALYEAITMALIAISIILSIIINGLHHRGPRKKKVPNIIRQIFLHGLKRVTCFGEDSYYPLDEMETISMRGLDRHMTEAESNTKPPESTSTSKLEKDVEQILKHMRGVAIRNSVSDSRADIRSEWQLVAMVIDRLLFGLYVLMIFIATIGVFA